MQNILDIIANSVKIGFYVFFILGVIVVFRYCIRIGYFPAGLDVGNVLLFLLVAICFAIISVVYFLLIGSVSVFLVWLIRGAVNGILSLIRYFTNGKVYRIDRIKVSTGLLIPLGLLTTIIALGVVSVGFTSYVKSTISTIGIISIIIAFLFSSSEGREPIIHTIAWDFQSEEGQRRIYSVGSVLLVMLFVLFVTTDKFFQLSKAALIMTSVSKRHVDVYLDNKMQSMFDNAKTVNKDYLVLNDVEILWTGVGSRSVIEVVIDGKTSKFVVNTDEMLFSYK